MWLKKAYSALDFILPRLCITCDTHLKIDEEILCQQCYSELSIADCEKIRIEYQRKFQKDNLITDFTSAYLFREDSHLQKIIHSLKYEHNFHAGRFLAKKIVEIRQNKIFEWGADLIFPIPLHSVRKADRGFNQAAEIAKGISKITDINFSTNIIKRARYTNTQTKFTLKERQENIKGAFRIMNKKKIIDKNIILIDDVITTGATVGECANILLNNGARKVFAISAAIAD